YSVKSFIEELAKKAAGEGRTEAFETAFSDDALKAAGIDTNGPELKRIDAAIILHIYMKEVAGIPDLKDIGKASVLRDLYDCRKCVNHIAQVYLRGLIKAVEYPAGEGSSILLFDAQKVTGKSDVFLGEQAFYVV
ncbi:MAG: hypothetical protein J6X66_00155, partial [Lachnospiraceae bacterium]|nr:hypothetical protein [Lachnospiraceae bacterium]